MEKGDDIIAALLLKSEARKVLEDINKLDVANMEPKEVENIFSELNRCIQYINVVRENESQRIG